MPSSVAGEIELGGVETPGSGVVDRTVVIQRLVEQVGGIGHRSPGCGRCFEVAAGRESPPHQCLDRIGREPHPPRAPEGLRPGEELFLVIPAAQHDGIAQREGDVGTKAVGTVLGRQADGGLARRERIVVAETVALADGAAGMAQVVLQEVAVGVVVHEVLVDVGDMIRPQQVAHLFVAARAGMAVGKAVAECQPLVRRGRK